MVAAAVTVRRSEASAEELLGSVKATMQSMIRRAHPALEAEGVSMGQFWALHFVSSLGGARISAVARYLAVTSPTVCAKVDDLESAGLVVRRRSERDHRVVELTLTPKGRKVEARLWEQIGALFGSAAAGLAPEDVAAATRVFRELRARLEEAPPHPEGNA
jgi:DNA-binding MarR family transcriptional regulator